MKARSILPLFLLLLAAFPARAAEQPNIVWLVSEDNSVHYLRLFTEGGAEMPNVERLAKDGLVYNRAFSNAPVCSVARTTLMSGIYPPRVAAQNHRALEKVDLPGHMRYFPSLLRDAGYYTTNNQKKDFNIRENDTVFDESSGKASWRNRPDPSTPFFHMQSFAVTHESNMHFGADAMDTSGFAVSPADVTLFPYFPDTPEFRFTHARYLELHRRLDAQLGQVVDRLKEDGLLDDTFIFYFGDHGGVLPRSKGYLYETGLHVPLVVRIPENWKNRVPAKRGDRIDGFVSFVDFAPTALRLAGIEPPEWLDGKAFLGAGVSAAEVASRDQAFGYAERMDAKYDFMRSIRKGDFKYIRSYTPHYPDALNNNYRYNMLAYRQWRNLHRAGTLGPIQRQFFDPKPVEALFDLRSDPFELRNLSHDPAHASVLKDLRTILQRKVRSLPDLSFFPENVLMTEAAGNPVEFAARRKDEVGRLADIADLMLLPFAEARPSLEAALDDRSEHARYWGLIVCSALGETARPLAGQARQLLEATEPLVRMRAAEFLGLIGEIDPRPYLRSALGQAKHSAEAGLILNTVVFFEDHVLNLDENTNWGLVPPRARSNETERQVTYLKTRSERR